MGFGSTRKQSSGFPLDDRMTGGDHGGLSAAAAASVDPDTRVIVGLAPAFGDAHVVGRAFTVQGVAMDNLALHRAIAATPAGSVIVAQLTGSGTAGHWGEIMTRAAQERGIAGLVLDGSVRDLRALQDLRFPVFHQGTDPRPATKVHAGSLAVPVALNGTMVQPGDIIVADLDGISVVESSHFDTVVEAARELAAKEAEILRRIADGSMTMDLLRLQSD
jgi:4-hydroxy-4-methyl-2-oxoglutarate aldolase